MWTRLQVRATGRPKTRLGTACGFTLVEVLVSLMVLGVALVSLWGFHWTSRHVNMQSKRETTALFLANEKLEAYRQKIHANDDLYNPNGTDNVTIENVLYTRTTSSTPDGTYSWKRNVTVSVRWAEQRGGQGQVVLQTIVVP
ncbi:type IV pilus modification PilV family protein [Desulfosoma sp.]|uniref:type IV pilus modification PilV family protein n=1 Tax=Desulfosoma sp. TaxID=2603217 RepID=UPI0040499FCB